MRDIIFRAMSIDRKKWVYGSFINTGVDAPAIVFGDGEQQEIDVKTLGQYIGLSDVLGNKIYEGDIVTSHYDNSCFGSVDFNKDLLRYNVRDFYNSRYDDPSAAFSEGMQLMMVGNIHDNPNLIKYQKVGAT